jgi:pyruvate/2-oxoglutarate dehydrogenase complex dihydrolipoamide acyltransferase (E2) component
VSRIAVTMPVLGFDQDSGRVFGWLKRVGDRVDRGDTIAEIETEKVTVGMEAIAAGTLVEIVAEAGAEVGVGGTLAWLDDGA